MSPGQLTIVMRALGCGLVLAITLLAANLASGSAMDPNPANDPKLIDEPVDPIRYDDARKCVKRVPKGILVFDNWLRDRTRRGATTWILRCERVDGERSIHSEGRAVDIALNAERKRQRFLAMRLFKTWLATDQRGVENALARRMGIQLVIYNCKFWKAGQIGFARLPACEGGRRGVDPIDAHRTHMHVEVTRPGSRLKTSYWKHFRKDGHKGNSGGTSSPESGGIDPSSHGVGETGAESTRR